MSEWIEWKGGECPVPPETIVDVKDRDGTIWEAWPAGNHYWWHDTDFPMEEPVAYRIITNPDSSLTPP
jgi:hypothetical protein